MGGMFLMREVPLYLALLLGRESLLECFLVAFTTRPRGIDGSVWPRKTAILEKPRREGS